MEFKETNLYKSNRINDNQKQIEECQSRIGFFAIFTKNSMLCPMIVQPTPTLLFLAP